MVGADAPERMWAAEAGEVCEVVTSAHPDTERATGAQVPGRRWAAANARQAANEAPKSDMVKRPMAQAGAIQNRIDAIEADRYNAGGFSTGPDVTADIRSGCVILNVPTANQSQGQRSLAYRLERKFAAEAGVSPGGSGASWAECDVQCDSADVSRRHQVSVVSVMPLGRVIGLLMDRHASTEAGRATVVYESDEESAEEVRVFWHSASVWRMERRGGGLVADGVQVQEWRGRKRWPPYPVREGWPDWYLQLVFPLRAHVFGRLGDDYFPSGVRAHEDAVLVTLQGMDDDRQGHLVVDAETGFIREAAYLSGGWSLRLTDLRLGPLDAPHRLFSITA